MLWVSSECKTERVQEKYLIVFFLGFKGSDGARVSVPHVDTASEVWTVMVLMGSHTEILKNKRQGRTTVTRGLINCYSLKLKVCEHRHLPPLMVIHPIITTLWKHYALQEEGLHVMFN